MLEKNIRLVILILLLMFFYSQVLFAQPQEPLLPLDISSPREKIIEALDQRVKICKQGSHLSHYYRQLCEGYCSAYTSEITEEKINSCKKIFAMVERRKADKDWDWLMGLRYSPDTLDGYIQDLDQFVSEAENIHESSEQGTPLWSYSLSSKTSCQGYLKNISNWKEQGLTPSITAKEDFQKNWWECKTRVSDLKDAQRELTSSTVPELKWHKQQNHYSLEPLHSMPPIDPSSSPDKIAVEFKNRMDICNKYIAGKEENFARDCRRFCGKYYVKEFLAHDVNRCNEAFSKIDLKKAEDQRKFLVSIDNSPEHPETLKKNVARTFSLLGNAVRFEKDRAKRKAMGVAVKTCQQCSMMMSRKEYTEENLAFFKEEWLKCRQAAEPYLKE